MRMRAPCGPCMQIYVEIERARLTKQLARMKEAEGSIAEAAEILQEVPVVSGPGGKEKKGSYLSSGCKAAGYKC